MNPKSQTRLQFDDAFVDSIQEETLVLDLEGYEGPLHVLLALAQSQKVDLLKLSITRLVDQYLMFIREARRRRFTLAADYLVMAAWLAFLKSRLLLPRPTPLLSEERPAEDVAAQLAFRLARLDAIRRSVEALNRRPILRQVVFPRGDAEATTIISRHRLTGDLHGLMTAYVDQRRRVQDRQYTPPLPVSFRLDDAREHVRKLFPSLKHWTGLTRLAPPRSEAGPSRASCVASTLSACLEMVKEGDLDARQLDHFEEIYLRKRNHAA